MEPHRAPAASPCTPRAHRARRARARSQALPAAARVTAVGLAVLVGAARDRAAAEPRIAYRRALVRIVDAPGDRDVLRLLEHPCCCWPRTSPWSASSAACTHGGIVAACPALRAASRDRAVGAHARAGHPQVAAGGVVTGPWGVDRRGVVAPAGTQVPGAPTTAPPRAPGPGPSATSASSHHGYRSAQGTSIPGWRGPRAAISCRDAERRAQSEKPAPPRAGDLRAGHRSVRGGRLGPPRRARRRCRELGDPRFRRRCSGPRA